MDNSAALALVTSVIMHVTWNLIARHQARDAYPLWWVLLAHLVLLGPWGLYSLFTEVQWTPALVKWVVISASANVVYFMGLRRAYDYAPVAFVYPLVHSSPILIALWSLRKTLGPTMDARALGEHSSDRCCLSSWFIDPQFPVSHCLILNLLRGNFILCFEHSIEMGCVQKPPFMG